MSKRTKRRTLLTKDKKFINSGNIVWISKSKAYQLYKTDKRKAKKSIVFMQGRAFGKKRLVNAIGEI